MQEANNVSNSVVLIAGSNSQTARCIASVIGRYRGLTPVYLSRSQMDIAEPRQVAAAIDDHRPQFLVNCAAFTAVDLAESEQGEAFRVNAEGPAVLAEACRRSDTVLIHFSTDYVYHNDIRRPLLETDPTSPRSIYAKSKLEGEEAVLNARGKALILRTSWLYSEYGHNFVKTMLRLAESGKVLSIVNDQKGTPTYARDLADAVMQIVRHVKNREDFSDWGKYNFANKGETTWYEFAMEIFKLSGNQVRATPVPTEEYETPAERPPYSVLNTSRVERVFGIEIRQWKDALAECLEHIRTAH